MKTIVITSQKGGSGKTTLAAHLAVEIERAGDGPAWLIDTDPQGTLSHWHERRAEETPNRIDVPIPRIRAGLTRAAEDGAAYCLIDTAPTISEQSRAMVALADLVIIPVRPSPADLWSVGETVDTAKTLGKPFLFVIMQSKANSNITGQAAAALSGHGRVAFPFIGNRVAYAVAMTSGNTAPELDRRSAAASEVAAVWSDVKSCFSESLKTPNLKVVRNA